MLIMFEQSEDRGDVWRRPGTWIAVVVVIENVMMKVSTGRVCGWAAFAVHFVATLVVTFLQFVHERMHGPGGAESTWDPLSKVLLFPANVLNDAFPFVSGTGWDIIPVLVNSALVGVVVYWLTRMSGPVPTRTGVL